MTDALTKFLTFKQVDGLTLAEYMTSFKEYRDIVKSQMGDRFLGYYVTQTQEYKDLTANTDKTKLQESASERFLCVSFDCTC